MRHRPLQGQRGRYGVDMGGKLRHARAAHKAKMIVAVRGLRRPARVHTVDLRCHLIGWPKPRF